MVFQVNEDRLKKRLKIYLPISFLIMSAISVGLYSILLKTIYELSNSLRGYIYLFITALALGIAISLFFDCLKIEKGKYIPLGIIYVVKSGAAVFFVAVLSYSIYIINGSITLFEIINIRLIMVIFLISMAMGVSSIFFNLLTIGHTLYCYQLYNSLYYLKITHVLAYTIPYHSCIMLYCQ